MSATPEKTRRIGATVASLLSLYWMPDDDPQARAMQGDF
jgi:hypothetical protein